MSIIKNEDGKFIITMHQDAYFYNEDDKDEMEGKEICKAFMEGEGVSCESMAEWKLMMHELGFPDDTWEVKITAEKIKAISLDEANGSKTGDFRGYVGFKLKDEIKI